MGRVFAGFFAPYLEKGIPDYIAHRPIIQVFTVLEYLGEDKCCTWITKQKLH